MLERCSRLLTRLPEGEADKSLLAEGVGLFEHGEELGLLFSTADMVRKTRAGDEVKPVIHCGRRMLTRTETMSRYRCAGDRRIPITNYGIAIAHLLGILPRALAPFRARGLAAE